MAHLYLSTESDSVLIDVTAGDRVATTMVEAADGVNLHLDDARSVVAIEVLDLSRRGVHEAGEPEMGRLHISPSTDSLYFDVSIGTRPPLDGAPIAEGVYLYVDGGGELVAIEVMDLTQRGGLHVDDLDAVPDSSRPPIFDEIERVASRPDGRASRT